MKPKRLNVVIARRRKSTWQSSTEKQTGSPRCFAVRDNGKIICKTLCKIIFVSSVLAACTVGPDYGAPENSIDEQWASENALTVADQTVASSWWESFGDPFLNELVQETVTHNKDIGITAANLERARALRQASIAPFFPNLNTNASAQRLGLSKTTSRNRTQTERERDAFDASLDAIWEIDLFGYTRRNAEAADARLDAAHENLHDMQMLAVAELAQSYFTARGLEKQIAVTQKNIALLENTESLAKIQFEAGVTTEFDYARAQGERQQIQATLPAMEADLATTLYRISVLTGKDPKYYDERLRQTASLPPPQDKVPIGLRSDILRRRPDIRRAERELAAANAEIGVAVADLFPRFSLTGSLGTSALRFGDLFTTSSLNHMLGIGLNWPIFAGGAQMAAIDAAKAEHKATLLAYEKTVLTALEETESALIRYGKEWQALQNLRAAEKQRVEAFNIAKFRYEAGEENFLTILDAERSLLDTQNMLVQSETRILSYLTQLYKALGGGWETF